MVHLWVALALARGACSASGSDTQTFLQRGQQSVLRASVQREVQAAPESLDTCLKRLNALVPSPQIDISQLQMDTFFAFDWFKDYCGLCKESPRGPPDSPSLDHCFTAVVAFSPKVARHVFKCATYEDTVSDLKEKVKKVMGFPNNPVPVPADQKKRSPAAAIRTEILYLHKSLCMSNGQLPEFPSSFTNLLYGSSAAYGDPHAINMRGEKFDILATGDVTLAYYPRNGTPKLHVQAHIERFGGCEQTYMDEIQLGGKWVIGNQQTVKPGNRGKLHVRFQNGSLTEVQSPMRMSFPEGPSITISWNRDRRHSWNFLDFSIQGLTTLSEEVGGILGIDSHDSMSAASMACAQLENQATNSTLWAFVTIGAHDI